MSVVANQAKWSRRVGHKRGSAAASLVDGCPNAGPVSTLKLRQQAATAYARVPEDEALVFPI